MNRMNPNLLNVSTHPWMAIVLLLSFSTISAQSAEELANTQLKAYNNRDINAFIASFSDTVKVYSANKLLYKGKQTMYAQYASMFDNRPELYCKLVNRIVLANTVIDHEEVTFDASYKIYAIVMYKVSQNKIQEVHFLERLDKDR